MPFFENITTPNGIIPIWKLSDTLDELSTFCTLNTSDKIKYDQLHSERRKKEFLASRILIQQLIPTEELLYNQAGKPFINNSSKHISISHSADFATVIVSNKPVGIDIEQATRNIDRVATRFLHPDEQHFIAQQKNQQFAKILFWAAKEAIFKCSEFQGIQFNEQIFIDPFLIEKSNKFSGSLLTSLKKVNYNLYYYSIENNVMVYCVEQ